MRNQLLQLIFFLSLSTVGAGQCKPSSTNFIPIADLGRSTFQGFTGGLYPGGNNTIPPVHLKAGMQAADKIAPLDPFGNSDSLHGKIGMLVLGYSTAAMTGRFFKSLYAAQNGNDQLSVVIGAQGGRDINSMTDSKSTYWTAVDTEIEKMGLTREQVEIVWLSTGDIRTCNMAFPDQCYAQMNKYQLVLRNIHQLYPNARIVFLSDRPYAGYIGGPGEGPQELKEPTAYYHSWTVKWVIEKQLENDAAYSLDQIPFIDWGPALWTNGSMGNAAGYTWDCDDAGKGGIHASSKGRMKEAALLYLFFSNSPYTEKFFSTH